jgi:hypothetical protein
MVKFSRLAGCAGFPSGTSIVDRPLLSNGWSTAPSVGSGTAQLPHPRPRSSRRPSVHPRRSDGHEARPRSARGRRGRQAGSSRWRALRRAWRREQSIFAVRRRTLGLALIGLGRRAAPCARLAAAHGAARRSSRIANDRRQPLGSSRPEPAAPCPTRRFKPTLVGWSRLRRPGRPGRRHGGAGGTGVARPGLPPAASTHGACRCTRRK